MLKIRIGYVHSHDVAAGGPFLLLSDVVVFNDLLCQKAEVGFISKDSIMDCTVILKPLILFHPHPTESRMTSTCGPQQGNPGFVSEKTGQPANLFRIKFSDDTSHPYAKFLLDVQDVEEYEILDRGLLPEVEPVAAAASGSSSSKKRKR
jgi:hypothetical protein